MLYIPCMDLPLLVLSAAVVGGGIIGGLIRAWSIHSRLYALETALAVVEGTLQREVKARAAGERWKKQEVLQTDLDILKTAQPQKKEFWWQKYSNPPKAAGG